MAVAVVAMEQSPLPPNAARTCMVNTTNTTPDQYAFSYNYAGLPGAENVPSTATMIPPTILARTPLNIGTKYTYAYCNISFGRRGIPANTSLVFQTVPVAQITT